MSADPRSRRHPAWAMAEARRLAADGWNAPAIVKILAADHDLAVSRDTVRRWIDDSYARSVAARVTARNRKVWAQRWTFRLGGHQPSPEYQRAFVLRLRAERVTWLNVARVCRVVFGGDWTADRCRSLAGEPRHHARRAAA